MQDLQKQAPTSEILAYADQMRDARRWADAATAYGHVVEREPGLAPIWVQLGHALKESGDQTQAEGAYRKAIHLIPNVAEHHLQLGHLLKVSGRRQEAISAFTEALRIDPEFRQAITELAALGVTWNADSNTDRGSLLLHQTLDALDKITQSLAKIEAQLPSLASLATVRVDHYDAFRRKFSVSLPPAQSKGGDAAFSVIVVDVTASGVSDILSLCHSLERQTLSPRLVTFLTTKQENAKCFNRIRGASKLPLEAASMVNSYREAWQRIHRTGAINPNDWMLIISGSITLNPMALAWFSFATSFGAAALYSDEDHLSAAVRGQNRFEVPVFKTAFDPLLVEQGGSYGNVIGIRRDALEVALPDILERRTTSEPPTSMSFGALLRCVAEDGPVGHIPRVLSSRLSSVEPKTYVGSVKQGVTGVSVSPNRTIRVVVPTRNQRSLLMKCIDTLRAKAANCNRLEFVVVDNASDDSDTRSYLDMLHRDGAAHVIRDDRPFNWALINNAAVEGSEAELFVFCNNDIEMLTDSWDQRVADALALENIGAIGAKLLYPDRTVQHAGVLFGPNGRSEHEAVNQRFDAPGPQGRWVRRRRVGAVTGAFLACRADAFRKAGGFDAHKLPIWFSDVDFCLRLRALGRHILFDPGICAVHHESKTVRSTLSGETSEQYWRSALNVMHQRWGRAMIEDPSFNPHFSRWDPPFSSITEPPFEDIIAHLMLSTSADPWRAVKQ